MTGIRTSIRTTSGPSCRAWRDRLRRRPRPGRPPAGRAGRRAPRRSPPGPSPGRRRSGTGWPAPVTAVPPSGSTAETTKPPPGAGPADSEPPSSATRSRIPVSPCPGRCSLARRPGRRRPGPLATRSRTAPASWPTRHGDGGARGVLAGVGQRLLHDPVGAQRRPPAGTWPSSAGSDSSTGTPARRVAVDQLGQVGELGLRLQRRGLCPGAARRAAAACRPAPRGPAALSEPNSARPPARAGRPSR